MELPSWLTQDNVVSALQNVGGKLANTWPAHVAESAYRGVLAPGQALASTEPINTAEMISPVMDMNTTMALGGAGATAAFGERMAPKAAESAMGEFHDYDMHGQASPVIKALFNQASL